jgi:ABC-type arginine transport system permease subunit
MLAFIFAAAINGLYFHITRMTNRILKAIELLTRESK